VDCVIAGAVVAPTSVPTWTDGGIESSPSVTELFAETLQRLTGDLGAADVASPAPGPSSDAPRKAGKTDAKHARESVDESPDDSSDDEDPAASMELGQVSWPICMFPQPVPEEHPGVPPEAAPASVVGVGASPESLPIAQDPVPSADPTALLRAEAPVVAASDPVVRESVESVEQATTEVALVPDDTPLDATPPRPRGQDTAPKVSPAAARSLARALEALSPPQQAEPAKPSAAPPVIEGNAPTLASVERATGDPGSRVQSAQPANVAITATTLAASANTASSGERGSEDEARPKADVPERRAPIGSGPQVQRGIAPVNPVVTTETPVVPVTPGLDLRPTTPPEMDVVRSRHQDVEVVPQLVRAMRTQFRDGIGEAQIRLKPEHLGEVRIDLKVDGDRVSAVLQVERPEVRQAIEAQSHSLRSGLAAQGLSLDDLEVKQSARARDDDHQGPQQQASPERRSRRHHQAPRKRYTSNDSDTSDFEFDLTDSD
jgi:flagellar hook-length control protein FliK